MKKVEKRAYDLFFTKEEAELMKKAAKLIDAIEQADDKGDFLEDSCCVYEFSEISYEVRKIANAMAEHIE